MVVKAHNLLVCGIFVCLLSSCGQATNELEETCTGTSCNESDINQPIGEENPSNPDIENPKDPSQDNYRLPTFNPAWGLTRSTYEYAVSYYEKHRNDIPNKRWVTIIDFARHSSKKRFFLFNLSNGYVTSYHTSHGKNSDPDNNGMATKFSNVSDSKQSSLGFYLTLGTYIGSKGYSMRIRGLEDTNDNAESRAIVVHPANYVSEEKNYAGRSWGCPALDPKVSKEIIDKIKGGSLLFIDSEPYSKR